MNRRRFLTSQCGNHSHHHHDANVSRGICFPVHWQDDGDTNATRTVTVTAPTYLTADYSSSGRGSCPFLYVWNGTAYNYVADVSDGTGWLGYLEYFEPNGSMVFSYNYPYDYIKLNTTQTQPVNGSFNMKIEENNDEIFYLDSAEMIAVITPQTRMFLDKKHLCLQSYRPRNNLHCKQQPGHTNLCSEWNWAKCSAINR